ncbi:MAG TPA: PIN domain-containing protein [Afifellaceae bacterium]|nr:PIN domain-containing protein [Afifellaceae bacterium]
MSVESFIDTNILVYAAAAAPHEEEKRRRAFQCIEMGEFGLSTHVLAEFYVTTTRKVRRPIPVEDAAEWVGWLSEFEVIAVDAALVRIGIELSQRFQISYWDGAVVGAAEALGAATLYTEDLNHGQLYGSVRVVNPFLEG